MRPMKNRKNRRWGLLLFSPAIVVMTACATTSGYVYKNVDTPVVLSPSDAHDFEYVRVDQSGDELTVYGKVRHEHTYCETEGHVDIAVVASDDQAAFVGSMPIVRGPSKRPGWYGAAFRAKLPVVLSDDNRILLAFHDPACITGPTFDCGQNAARTDHAEPAHAR